MDETRLIGNLPNVRVEVTHRQDPDGAAEHMTIHMTATPSFEAALPLAMQLPTLFDFTHPLTAWSAAAQAMMAPWQAMAQANPLMGFLPRWGDER
jgi:hypothetical protein